MKNMKKSSKVLGLIILGAILSLSLIGIVSAADNPAATFINKLSEIITKIFGGETNYDYISNILSPQVLFGVLIFLVIFAVVSQISLFAGKTWLEVTVSIVVGLLAGGFINPAWIQPLLNQYEALGVAITFIVPFIGIFFFLKEVAPTNQLVQKFVWFVYLMALIFTYILNFGKMAGLGAWPHIIYLFMGIASIILLVKGKSIYKKIWENELENAFDQHAQIANLINAGKKADAQNALNTVGATLPPAARARMQAIINKMP